MTGQWGGAKAPRPPGYATVRSDANQSQISGGDADVDDTQIIGGINPPPPPPVSAPLYAAFNDALIKAAKVDVAEGKKLCNTQIMSFKLFLNECLLIFIF